jgi:DNA-binding CsgD family transcriptional regulator
VSARGRPARWRIEAAAGADPAAVLHALRERGKELNCLYGIARLAERHPGDLDRLLRGAAALLPAAWQYPADTCARITLRGRTCRSPGFAEGPWRQAAPIVVSGRPAGEVAVYYRRAHPASFEGPFLREERALIDAVADHLGLLADRVAAAQELKAANRLLTVERAALRESNIALKTVLAKIEEEKRALARDIRANVERVLLPILHALAIELPPRKRSYLDLLRQNLLDITAPFTQRLTAAHPALTPAEVAICTMIRNGLPSKEIARLRGIAIATVNRHREHIRRKLGLTGRGVNLITRLQGQEAGGG